MHEYTYLTNIMVICKWSDNITTGIRISIGDSITANCYHDSGNKSRQLRLWLEKRGRSGRWMCWNV